jgi:purine-binding chemotaxis protein CheW
MAKRSPRAARHEAAPAGGGEGATTERDDAGAADTHLALFRIADSSFGFRLGDVDEIVRLPALAPMPLSPPSLLGLANLRGVVLPVVSLRRLLGLPEVTHDETVRVIVIGRGAPVGFVVDRVEKLAALPAGGIEQDDAGAGSVDPAVLDGIVRGAEGRSTIKILNPERLLHGEFARLGVSAPRAATGGSVSATQPSTTRSSPTASEAQSQVSLLSFDLGQQEYAVPLERVREIIPFPDQVSEVAGSETAVLGVVTWRDDLLPLVSLRALLGLPSDLHREEKGKVVVLSMGNGSVGVVADRAREILHVAPGLIDPAPALLTRGAGDAEVTSICRLDAGKRLVALLSPDRLFRSDLVRRVLSEHGNGSELSESRADGDIMPDEQFIIFRLGEQEYGLPIGAVDEIARPPEQITRLPKAPAFIDGLMNLRGSVVPIIDLRRRFELMSAEPASTRRILILTVGGGKAGFIVDGVSEVMKVPAGNISPAPELSAEQMRLIGRVANLDARGRMILLVDPAQLLDRLETDMLAKLDPAALEQAMQAS